MKGRRWLVVGLGVGVAAAAVWAARAHWSGAHPAASGSGAQPTRVVPVVAVAVERRDVPVYLQGLGTVTALDTVTVRPQVDGRMDKVLFKEGETVHKGQVLAQIDPRPFRAQLHQAQGALARDQAQLSNAQVNVARDKALAAEGLVPRQQLDGDTALVSQYEGTIRVDQAAIETAQLNLDYTRITAPIDGVTGIRLIDAGNVVHAADPGGIVVITQLDPIAVLFALPQEELTPVAEEVAHGKLTVDAYSRDGSTLLGSGDLSLIDNEINSSTSTIRLKAVLPNAQRLLWPNEFVNARLRLTTRRGALVVPAVAVQRGPTGTFVYVVAAGDTVAVRPVTLQGTEGDLAIVSQGVAEGERVVTDGQAELRPGSRVAPRVPAAAASSAPVAQQSQSAAPGADGGAS